MYIPTQEDKEILNQDYIDSRIKIELLNNKFQTIDTLEEALISDNYSIDADSDIRRTYEGTFFVKDPSFFIGENKKIWTDKYIRIWKGRLNIKTNKIVWYNQGIYLFNDTSYTYNETTNAVNINCIDRMAQLNNTFSGQVVGAFDTLIPCESTVVETVEKSGEVHPTSIDNKTISKTIVSIGTTFTFSLQENEDLYWKDNHELSKIELIIFNPCIYDNNNIDSSETSLRLSIDNVVKTQKEEDTNGAMSFEIDINNFQKNTTIAFLQKVSFTQIMFRFEYVEIPREGDTVHYLDVEHTVLKWYFSDTKFFSSCLSLGEDIISETTKKFTHSDGENYLIINTTKRAYEDTVKKQTSWYKVVIDTIEKSGITDYMVQYSDMTIPYDLEFSTGASYYDILKELVSLMTNWEMFFDVNGTLIIQPIPTLYEDEIILTSDELFPLIISETKKDTFSNIRNITEIWGMSIDASYYSENCFTLKDNKENIIGYRIEFSDLIFTDEKRISNNTILSAKFSDNNIANPQIQIVGKYNNVTEQTTEDIVLDSMYLYTSSGDVLDAGILKKDISYCFKYYKGKLYFLGQFRVHAMCIETTNEPTLSQKEENKIKYNCENIYYSVEPNSPYCIEKIGERINVLSGEDYENIYSDTLGIERAKWENWKTTRRQETISLDIIDIPYLDVNCKIEYKSFVDGETHQYIIKKISSNTSEPTMSLELMRFYPLYILDAKQYEAVIELKNHHEYLLSQYSYTEENVVLLQSYVDNGEKELYLTENTESVKTVLESYKNKLNSVRHSN